MERWGPLPLRLAVGTVFLVHGAQKLFVTGLGGLAETLGRLGVPAPAVAAGVVGLVEFAGGLALILGLFTRWAAALLAINMAVAILKVHLPAGFLLPRGYEFALTLLGGALALVLLGAGVPSIDAVRQGRPRRGRKRE